MKLSFAFAAFAYANQVDEKVWLEDPSQTFSKELSESTLTWNWEVPKVDGKYEKDQYLRVSVSAPTGYTIQVSFSNFFLENKSLDGKCSHDVALVYDGLDGGDLAAAYCGTGDKAAVMSTSNQLTVVFKSDENHVVGGGFGATFEAIATPRYKSAWIEIEEAFKVIKSDVFKGHHKLSLIKQGNKANKLQEAFMRFLNLRSRAAPSCTNWAGTGNPDDFTPPDADSSDACLKLESFFNSLSSYHNSFVCMDGWDQQKQPKLAPAKMEKLIAKMKHSFFHNKLKKMNCA